MRLDVQERQGHVVRVPGLGKQRHEPRQRGRRLPREAPERLAPVVGTLAGQQVQHLIGRGRPVAEHVHQRVRQDVRPQHPPELRRVRDLLTGDELDDLRHRLLVHPRIAQHRELLRRRKRKRVVDLPEEPLRRQPLLGDHRVLAELDPEDLLGDLPDALLVPALPQRGGRRHRADLPQRPAGPRVVRGGGQATQQHRHVGTLRPVVGVELVHHHIGDVRVLPQREVLTALQQQVQHLVVRDQDVRPLRADLRPFGQHPGVRRAGSLADVQPGGDILELGPGEEIVDPYRLVGGQRVHRVEQHGPHAPPARSPGPPAVIEHRHEERLSLPRPGTRRHQRRLRLTA